ncbi:MAG: glucose-1-phosphate adenylyltransferase [Candidatus Marinimicrobia bacterium]|nr:glucose-1-phosphate adenylyltransferase [Candidatus Neomarinimicrobiota bacterium]
MNKQQKIAAIILGGGRGERLYPLTKLRSKPAVPIGGKYRLIDVPISNCINSQMNQIYILTQFNTHSLHRHIFQTYKFDVFDHGNIEILGAQQTQANTNWFQGTADAVRSYWPILQELDADHYIILAGDHLYTMDYREFFNFHLNTGSDLTIAAKPMPVTLADQLGILHADTDHQITSFMEKPQSRDLYEKFIESEDGQEQVLSSMGIYIFSKSVLQQALGFEGNDFGKNIIPQSIEKFRTSAFRFNGYWEDIGTIRTFFDASIDMTRHNPQFSFYTPGRPIYTHPRFLPGSRIENALIHQSIISDGCMIGSASIKNSILGIRSIIGNDASLDQVYFMGADLYENEKGQERFIGVGEGSTLSRVIVDKNVRIGKGVRLTNSENRSDAKTDLYTIKDGIIIIPKGVVIPDGMVV